MPKGSTTGTLADLAASAVRFRICGSGVHMQWEEVKSVLVNMIATARELRAAFIEP